MPVLSSKQKVAVAMSGGVDSSVTAGMLVHEGYDVTGVSLRLWEGGDRGPRHCSDHVGAAQITALLGIPHVVLDLRSSFRETVVRPFAQSYLSGQTPNPCVSCNRDFKLGHLLEWATQHGIETVATGHYARVVPDTATGDYTLWRGVDRNKDQSYFLFSLSQRQLARTVFPLGGLWKEDVRRKARDLGLPVADRAESQDICLGDHRALVASYAGAKDLSHGEIVDRSGRVLGTHRGIHGFTIGQRKGLGVSAPEPLYVLEIDALAHRVVVGPRRALKSGGFLASAVQWIRPPQGQSFKAEAQVRYRSQPVACVVRPLPGRRMEVKFEREQPAVTPGQAAVMYQGERVLGGGWIESALPR